MDQRFALQFLRDVRAECDSESPRGTFILFLEAFMRRDFAALAGILAPDVELNFYGFPPLRETIRGRDAVVTTFRVMEESLQHRRPVFRRILSDGDELVIFFRDAGAYGPTAEAYCRECAVWLKVEQGKVAKIDRLCAQVL